MIAAVVAVALVTSNGGSSSSKTPTKLPDAGVIAQQFAGIPQSANVLGKASAPATLVEYIDLQCPVCRQFETEVMPTIIDRYVRTGKLKVVARPVTVIGPDSETGRRAMIAAFKQNRGFNFAQLLYFNQGPENGGWLDNSMVADAATSIPGVNVAALQSAAGSKAVQQQASHLRQPGQGGRAGRDADALRSASRGGKLTSLGAGLADASSSSARRSTRR